MTHDGITSACSQALFINVCVKSYVCSGVGCRQSKLAGINFLILSMTIFDNFIFYMNLLIYSYISILYRWRLKNLRILSLCHDMLGQVQVT